MRKQIFTEKGVQPGGPYSQAIVAEGAYVFVAGQGPTDPKTGELRLGSFREQAERTFKNIGVLLEAAGSSFEHVVKVHAYLADLSDFAEFNEVYRQFFTDPYPARTTVGVNLPRIALEVDCIAIVPQE
jgi:2-iminobutanoate/2-iminopropanoate deaminase